MKKLIAFFEIPASDFHRAVDFYETVLGMQLPTFECETEKMACFTEEGETVGAISYASNFDFLPSTHGVLIHFNCEDIEQTLEKVLLKGGKVVIPRTKIEADMHALQVFQLYYHLYLLYALNQIGKQVFFQIKIAWQDFRQI